MKAGIVGAGIGGRLLALGLAERGWDVAIFDKDGVECRKSCSWTGAGMIAPYCEQESAEPVICNVGLRSLELWPIILNKLPEKVFYQADGSLVVTHPNDADELRRLRREVESREFDDDVMQILDSSEIAEIEPELSGGFQSGLFFPYEAQVDNWKLMKVTHAAMIEANVDCSFNTMVDAVEPGELSVDGEKIEYDLVFDCRGIDASDDLPNLRGVRGELLHVIAPEVGLTRPVRMMHPRYPLYVVPRENDRFVIGATKIESHDLSEISVRGTLELLSAAYALHTGFAEARIIETNTHCRPAMPDNLPYVDFCDKMVRFNGMFRHGFLIAPTLVEAIIQQVCDGKVTNVAAPLTYYDGKRQQESFR